MGAVDFSSQGFSRPTYNSAHLAHAGAWVHERFQQEAAAKVCVILIDGLGYQQIMEREQIFSPILEVFDSLDSWSTVTPSTTAAALASFGTGILPKDSGIAGYQLRHPLSGNEINQITWQGVADHHLWHGARSFATHLPGDARSTTVSHPQYEFSTLTQTSLATHEFIGQIELVDRLAAARHALATPGPQYVYLYWEKLDAIGHQEGPASRRWNDNAQFFAKQLRKWIAELPADVQVVLTADHGIIDVRSHDHIDLQMYPELRHEVDLLSGEPRFRHVYLREPERKAEIASLWQLKLGDRALVVLPESAAGQQIFGGFLSPWARQCVGDFTVVMRERWILVDSITSSKGALTMKGHHGSLTPAEVEIPWFVRGAASSLRELSSPN